MDIVIKNLKTVRPIKMHSTFAALTVDWNSCSIFFFSRIGFWSSSNFCSFSRSIFVSMIFDDNATGWARASDEYRKDQSGVTSILFVHFLQWSFAVSKNDLRLSFLIGIGRDLVVPFYHHSGFSLKDCGRDLDSVWVWQSPSFMSIALEDRSTRLVLIFVWVHLSSMRTASTFEIFVLARKLRSWNGQKELSEIFIRIEMHHCWSNGSITFNKMLLLWSFRWKMIDSTLHPLVSFKSINRQLRSNSSSESPHRHDHSCRQ